MVVGKPAWALINEMPRLGKLSPVAQEDSSRPASVDFGDPMHMNPFLEKSPKMVFSNHMIRVELNDWHDYDALQESHQRSPWLTKPKHEHSMDNYLAKFISHLQLLGIPSGYIPSRGAKPHGRLSGCHPTNEGIKCISDSKTV